jgi:hypothetical protein
MLFPMTSIHMEIQIDRPASEVWEAVSDVGAAHDRLARGFVVATRLEDSGAARLVTFANGAVARELILDVDHERRRVAYAVVDSPLGMTYHHATMEVVAHGERAARLVWVVDVAPAAAAGPLTEMMEDGASAMSRTLGGAPVVDVA